MKRILSLLLSISLSLCLSVPLSSCSTSGGGISNPGALAGSIVQLAAMQQLSKAKTEADWTKKHAQLASLTEVLASVNEKGLTIEALRPILAERLADKPYAVLLIDLILAQATPPGAAGAVNNQILAAIVTGLRAAVAMPPPVFAGK